MSVSKIRERYVTTLPKSLRRGGRIKVGDYLVWFPTRENQFLVAVAPAERYKALDELLGGVELSPESRRIAEKEYLKQAGGEA